jgi:regulator of protease activity HflC (stomatin/prohibitin superfamily)
MFKKFSIIAASLMALSACSQVDDNQIGLRRTYGEIQEQPVRGLVWYNPWSTDIITFDNQQTKVPQEVTAPTHDQQRAHIKSVATVQLDSKSAAKMYRNVGPDWVNAIVPQIIKSTQQSIIGQVTAVSAIQDQAGVEATIRSKLKDRLAIRGITLTDYQITSVEFSKDYMDAVERKATETQQAEAEKNKTASIREQGEQKKIAALAEAEAMRVKANALTNNPNLIEYERLSVQREAIKAWASGGSQVPTTVMGSGAAGVPFVNIPLDGGK